MIVHYFGGKKFCKMKGRRVTMSSISLSERIEYLRERLLILLSYNSLTSSKVVNCSQELDNLLVQYEKLKNTERIVA